ncbi:MAG TPA: hypothetical protein VMW66_03990 [Elusimicrobiales bacterium]|nr:hypothetical protein [Elusimicrobiales bacterium]
MKIAGFLALLVLFILAQMNAVKFKTPYPAVKSFKSSAVSDVGFLSSGLRRLGADIAFIAMMQYYGSPEEGDTAFIADDKQENKDRNKTKKKPNKFKEYHVYGLSKRPSYADIEKGYYPELFDRTMHILSLDPYFTHVVLSSSACLAFGLNRSDEALEILEFARKYSPDFTRYQLYIAAIGQAKAKNPGAVADIMDEILQSPETPDMVKNVTAFLNKKIGRYQRAYEIYQDLYQTSKDTFYIENSKKQMKILKQEHLK